MSLKILHTADWHLGKKLDSFSRIEEQREVLDEICLIAERESVDLVLLAGDLFDTFNPPVEAVDLFYKTLKRLANNGQRPVIAIAGNHDSPERIDAPDPLARECGIIFIGLPQAQITPFEIEGFFKVTKTAPGFLELKIKGVKSPIRILHTPYANEVRLKKMLAVEDKNASLNHLLKEEWHKLTEKYCKTKGVNLLISHLYMLDRDGEILDEPEGERPLKIGNADLIYSDSVPEKIQYTALGHLHRAHQLGSKISPIMYSGSPIAYSFSESEQKKYVVIVEAEEGKAITSKKVPLQKGRILSRVTFENVDEAIFWLMNNKNVLVELTLVCDEFLKAGDIKRIYQAHDGVITIIPKVKEQKGMQEQQLQQVNLQQDITGLFSDYFKQRYQGQEVNEDILALFKEILNQE